MAPTIAHKLSRAISTTPLGEHHRARAGHREYDEIEYGGLPVRLRGFAAQSIPAPDNCPVSMYLAVIALNLAAFGLVVVSQRIWRLQFISATAPGPDRWFHNAGSGGPAMILAAPPGAAAIA